MTAWVYIPSASMAGTFVHFGTSVASADGFSMGVGSGTLDSSGNEFIGLLDGVAWMPFGKSIGTGWHFVVMTRDTTTWRGYVDTTLAPNTYTNTPNLPTWTWSFGRDADPSPRLFAGRIDDVRIYNRALSASEVMQLYKLGAGTNK